MKKGRPSKYDPIYCDMAHEIIGANGKSLTVFARDIGVTRATVWNWSNEYPEFFDALTQAQEASQAVWEEKLEGMMLDNKVNAPLVKLYFANRFNWHDKTRNEVSGPDGAAIPTTIQIIGHSEDSDS